MHHPPAWLLDDSERLTPEGFHSAFAEAWRRLERRFLKVECWQSYQEPDGVRSQEAFQRGDLAAARHLLMEEAEDDQPLYEEVRSRRLEFSRIRLISPPLTDYLRYEMINYEIRRSLGEHIEFIVPRVPVETYFDFLLFDSRTALIHDYGSGPVGRQVGGWITRLPKALGALADTAADLRAHGTTWTNPETTPGTSGT